MRRTITHRPLYLACAILALALPTLVGPAEAETHESGVAEEIEALIMSDNDYVRENLMDREGGVSQHGSLEFWSSGGLMQHVPADAPSTEYEEFSITPKHIQVIELPGGAAAVALYYSEGSMHPKGGGAVDDYLTRVLQVFVKEDGEWVARAAHWSPITGGAGTSQTSLD